MKNILLIYMLGITSIALAQTRDYNLESLHFFDDENWDDLIEVCEDAIETDQSTFEIEYRLAVAYYNTKRYIDSATHFENINKTYNINNDYLREYLYYSYLFSGREQDALLILKDSPFHLQQKINESKSQFIDFISLQGGFKSSNRKDIGIENLYYFNLGLGLQVGYRTKINLFYSSISQNYIDFDYKQREFYANANIQLSKGLTLIPAYHYVNILENTVSSYGMRRTNLIYSTANYGKINMYHIAIKKQWNRFSIMPNLTYTNTNTNDDIVAENFNNNTQYGIDMAYTIKGLKDKVRIGLGTYLLTSDLDNDFIWDAELLYQISPKVYLYIKYLNANTSNFSENNAMYYYNSVSVLIDKISTTFGYNFTPEFSWFINYQYENDEDIENDLLFYYNTFITGLKYDF